MAKKKAKKKTKQVESEVKPDLTKELLSAQHTIRQQAGQIETLSEDNTRIQNQLDALTFSTLQAKAFYDELNKQFKGRK